MRRKCGWVTGRGSDKGVEGGDGDGDGDGVCVSVCVCVCVCVSYFLVYVFAT